MLSVFNAASAGATGGEVPASVLPLLYTEVEAEMAASLQATNADINLDASGQSGGSSIDLATISGEVNAAYSTFATSVRTAELSIPTTTPPPPVTPGISIMGSSAVVGTTGSSTLTFTVTLSAASTSPVTVDYATMDDTAIATTDYTPATGVLTFAPGTTSQTVDVTVLGETTTATEKMFTLNLTDPSNATITTTNATGVIMYSTATPSIGVADASTSVGTTGTATLAFTVSLSGVSPDPVTVDYATMDGTALAGTDYTAATGTLNFSPGTTSVTVDVTVTGETSTVPSKTFTLNLTGGTNTTNATASAIGTINYATGT
jgi:chitinase